MKQLDYNTQQAITFFEKNYSPLVTLHLNAGKRIYLGNKTNRVCRFCGKNNKETSFKNTSHAIPEFMGNKLLIANYECDLCNAKFSRILETHLSNYMHMSHTLSQVKGKKGVPTFKAKMKRSRIDVEPTAIVIKDFEDDSMSEINEADKTITITSARPGYIPIAVFKCFVKMALTIIPENELVNFENTLRWINEEDHKDGPYNFHDLKLLAGFYPGVHPFNFITIGLLKRKEACIDEVPYMIFFIAYSNYYFQVHLPLCKKDEDIKDASVRFFPAHAALDLNWSEIKRKVVEMKGKEIVKNEIQSIVMQANSILNTLRSNNGEATK